MSKVPPGWNDPPPVSSNYQASGHTSKSRLSQKRVPFSFTSSNVYSPINEIPKINQLPVSLECDSVSSSINKNAADISKIIEILEKISDNLQDSNKKVDILKRLDIMKKMWENNELNLQVKEQIFTFANSLEFNDIKQATDVYLALTLSYASMCSSWIIAFKYILHHCKD